MMTAQPSTPLIAGVKDKIIAQLQSDVAALKLEKGEVQLKLLEMRQQFARLVNASAALLGATWKSPHDKLRLRLRTETEKSKPFLTP